MAATEPIPAADTTAYRSARIRRAIYVVTALVSIGVTYCGTKEWIGPAELAAWASVVALVNGLAAFNVQTGPRG